MRVVGDVTYTLKREGGFVRECERCNSPAALAEVGTSSDGKTKLCRFCYETELGTILAYPRQYEGLVTLTRGLCQALNLIDGKRNG